MTETERMAINRKNIRLAQMKELLFVGYLLWFAIEYLIRLSQWTPKYDGDVNGFEDVYDSMSFIVEQRKFQRMSFWYQQRKHYHWLRYMKI